MKDGDVVRGEGTSLCSGGYFVWGVGGTYLMSAVGVLSAAVMAPLFALLTVMSVDMPGGMESGVGARSDHASDGAGGHVPKITRMG